MKARRPVKTVIDYRTAAAARPTATLERPNEADQHDTAARALGKQVLIAAAEDLCARSYPARPDYKTEEGREAAWCMGRKAALLREIRRRRLTPTDRMP